MMVAIQHFESIVSLRWFVDSSVVVLMSNIEAFQDSLHSYPLSVYFGDYAGSETYANALGYSKRRFLEPVCRRPEARDAVCHVMEPGRWGARRLCLP